MLWANRVKKASRATAGLTTDPMSIAMPISPTFEATLSSFGHGGGIWMPSHAEKNQTEIKNYYRIIDPEGCLRMRRLKKNARC